MSKKINRFKEFSINGIKKVDTKTIPDSIPIMNSRSILNFLVDLQTKAFEKNQKTLSASLVEELTLLFGKQNTTITNEYRVKTWVLEYRELIFNVFTAKGRGTTFEISGLTNDEVREGAHEKEIKEFLLEINDLINFNNN